MRRTIAGFVGIVGVAAGLFVLAHLIGVGEEFEMMRQGEVPWWDPLVLVAFIAGLSGGALFFSFRLLRFAFKKTSKHVTEAQTAQVSQI